jgi:uncharacterized repeat protein (TIGR03803 family)
MRAKRHSVGQGATLAIVSMSLLVTSTWTYAQEKVLHSFNEEGGYYAYAGLILGASGGLYGVTYEGGSDGCDGAGCGTIFELTPSRSGRWSEKVLYNFRTTGGRDGFYPQAGLIFDAAGNLYGTTYAGGAHGDGTVFELTPTAKGGWSEKVLHSFRNNGEDGYYPDAGLVFDASGNLYGTTNEGGAHAVGTVFQLTPHEDGSWSERVLHSFNNNFNFSGKDGFYPEAGLVFNAAGSLYGTTLYGGVYGAGTVFELTPTAEGDWSERVLHSFNSNGKDGYYPYAGLILGPSGNLYGTTYAGGAYDYGTVFEVAPTAGGVLAEKVLYSFNDKGTGGYSPYAGLILDSVGSLYGTTLNGGAHNSGTVFELTSTAGGSWMEKVLHSFRENGSDGVNPYAGLIFDAAGNLYGTTAEGGAHDTGTVFEVTP